MNQYEMTYCTVDEFADYLLTVDPNAIPNSTQQAEYNDFFRDAQTAIWQASAIIDNTTNNKFAPYITTNTYYTKDFHVKKNFNGEDLMLDEFIQEVSSVTSIGSAVSSAKYRLIPPNDNNRMYIRFGSGVSTYGNSDFDAITVTGTWLYHDDYPNAWATFSTLDTDVLTTTQTSISVTDASVFQVLHYIRINSEFMQVLGVDTTLNNLTVKRGVNGTTATTHTNGDSVDVFAPLYGIRMVCERIAGFLFQNRGTVSTQIQFPESQQIVSELPPTVRTTLSFYTKPLYRVV